MSLLSSILAALAAIPKIAAFIDKLMDEWDRIRHAKLDQSYSDATARHDAAVDAVLREHAANGGRQADSASAVQGGSNSSAGLDANSLENGR